MTLRHVLDVRTTNWSQNRKRNLFFVKIGAGSSDHEAMLSKETRRWRFEKAQTTNSDSRGKVRAQW